MGDDDDPELTQSPAFQENQAQFQKSIGELSSSSDEYEPKSVPAVKQQSLNKDEGVLMSSDLNFDYPTNPANQDYTDQNQQEPNALNRQNIIDKLGDFSMSGMSAVPSQMLASNLESNLGYSQLNYNYQ